MSEKKPSKRQKKINSSVFIRLSATFLAWQAVIDAESKPVCYSLSYLSVSFFIKGVGRLGWHEKVRFCMHESIS